MSLAEQPWLNRTPQEMVDKWVEYEAAFLNDVAHKNLGCEIQTRSPEDETRAILRVRLASWLPPRYTAEATFYKPWQVLHAEGDSTVVNRINGFEGDERIIEIESFPAADTPYYSDETVGPSRFYIDMLFRNGQMDIYDFREERFSLGNVIGLTLLTPTENLPVWEPEV